MNLDEFAKLAKDKFVVQSHPSLVGPFIWTYAILACLFSVYIGRFQFGGYDLSSLVDLQARIAQEAIPGIDYYHTFPFTYSLFLKLYGLFFAPTWMSLFLLNAFIFLLSVVVIYCFWPKCFPVEKQALTVIVLSLPLLYTNHIWHSSMSQFLAVGYLILSLNFLSMEHFHKFRYQDLLIALFSGLLFFSKQNIGLPMIAIFSTLLMGIASDPERRSAVFSLLLLNFGGIILIVGALLIAFNMPVWSLVDSFLSVVTRVIIAGYQTEVQIKPYHLILFLSAIGLFITAKQSFPGLRVSDTWAIILTSTLLICAGFVTATGFHQGIGNYDSLLVFALVGMFVAFMNGYTIGIGRSDINVLLIGAAAATMLPIATDWDTKYNDAPLPMVCFILAIDLSSKITTRIVMAASILVTIAAATGGYVRQRMHDAGPGAFWENTVLTPVTAGYFNNLYAGPRFHQARTEMAEALAGGAANENVFCGPRLEFCYIDKNLPSPRGLPIWWHPGTSYPPWAHAEVVEAFKAQRFTILIFLHDDRTGMAKEILDYVVSTYTLQSGFGVLDVYRLKR